MNDTSVFILDFFLKMYSFFSKHNDFFSWNLTSFMSKHNDFILEI